MSPKINLIQGQFLCKTHVHQRLLFLERVYLECLRKGAKNGGHGDAVKPLELARGRHITPSHVLVDAGQGDNGKHDEGHDNDDNCQRGDNVHGRCEEALQGLRDPGVHCATVDDSPLS